ncbi:MAG: DUF1343 domain-containing protein [Thermoprotei archaeon]
MSVKSGLDILLGNIGLLGDTRGVLAATNHTALSADLTHITAILTSKLGDRFKGAVSPEHGLYSEHREGEVVYSGVDPLTGKPVYSWYSEEPGFKDEWFNGVDTLLYDIQDGGVRYHTHLAVLRSAIEFCTRRGIRLIVLDRPNPIRGDVVEGNIPDSTSIVCAWRIPIRYALTVGELAQLIATEMGSNVDLHIIGLEGWRRNMWYDQTGMVWVPLSPNTPTLTTSILYPGTCLFEGTELSVGRGTTTPFELLGSPWLDCVDVAHRFNALKLDGVRCRPTVFSPNYSKYNGEKCRGIYLHVLDRDALSPIRATLHLMRIILDIHGEQMVFGGRWRHFDLLTGSDKIRRAMVEGADPNEVVDSWGDEITKYKSKLEKHKLYP